MDYYDIYSQIDYCNLPYDKDDKYFEPLTDSYQIEEWEKWLKYTAETIDISVDDLKSKNFTTMKDLLDWCATDDRYYIAYKKYNKQCNKYNKKWAKYIKNNKEEFGKYSIYSISYHLEEWLYDLFRSLFIWSCDTRSIMEAKGYNDVAIFDTSPMECFLYDYLIDSEILDNEDDKDDDDNDDDKN